MLRRLSILLATVLGLVLAIGVPASAAGGWQTYTMTPEWLCNSYRLGSASGPVARSCVKANTNSHAQAITTVSNYTGSNMTITAPNVTLRVDDGRVFGRACTAHNLLNNTSRACFGPTGPGDGTKFCNWMYADVTVTINGARYSGLRSPNGHVCV